MNYKGIIIEESLEDKSILQSLKILKTKVEKVSEKHKTPWLKNWTLHNIEISTDNADEIARNISLSFDKKHPNWYADFKDEKYHFIAYSNKVFKVDLNNPILYQEAKKYGLSIGIPDYQVDFAPDDEIWKR